MIFQSSEGINRVLNKTFEKGFSSPLVLNPQAVCVNHLEEIWKDDLTCVSNFFFLPRDKFW